MRLFAAFGFEPEIRDRLVGLQKGLPEGRLTPWENLHLSLAFFDEVDGAVAADLHSALDGIKARAFDIMLENVDAFGGSRPRLLYADVRPEPGLSHLRNKIAQAARDAGVTMPAERFTPHVTLKRLHPGEMSAPRVARWLQASGGFMAGPLHVEEFSLFRSTLHPVAPVYHEVARYSFAESVDA